jgi:class 3 adenylate cyclase
LAGFDALSTDSLTRSSGICGEPWRGLDQRQPAEGNAGLHEAVAEMGDVGWKRVLASFYALADDKLRRFRGRKLDTAGDGLFAAFDGPARAVRCGASLARAVEPLGLRLRVGVHTGECEVLGEKYSGMAVHVGARVASAAEPGQVLVSSIVKNLVVGSGLQFADIGLHALKGVPGEWHLFAATVS